MTRILLDANLVRQLRLSSETVELCDPSGQMVGHFVPIQKPPHEIPFTEEEIQLAEQQTGGRRLVDILADLEKK